MYLLNQICEKGILFFYSLTLFCAWHLCHYGELRTHLILLLSCVLGFLTVSILWFVSWRGSAETEYNQHRRKIWVRTEWIAGILVTVLFLIGLAYSMTPSHGAISYKMLEYNSSRNVELRQTNIFETGLRGVYADLDRELDLPADLYLTNQLQLSFNQKGILTDLYTYVYGKDEHGQTLAYLIEYNAKRDRYAHVRISREPNLRYDPNMRVEPFEKILEQADYKEQAARWIREYDADCFEMLYVGQRTFTTSNGLVYLPGDVDGDQIIGKDTVGKLHDEGGEMIAFMVSFYVPQSTIKPVRYIMDPIYHSPEMISQTKIREMFRDHGERTEWILDRSTGAVYFLFHNSPNCWRLSVTDIRRGNRSYRLEHTEDGGDNWNTICEDPFDGETGLAEGMEFFSPDLGFLALSNFEGRNSKLFRTTDRGKTLQEIKLPYDQVTTLPNTEEESLRAEHYDYLLLPEKTHNGLRLVALTNKNGSVGLEFRSTDAGLTWIFSGTVRPKLRSRT